MLSIVKMHQDYFLVFALKINEDQHFKKCGHGFVISGVRKRVACGPSYSTWPQPPRTFREALPGFSPGVWDR